MNTKQQLLEDLAATTLRYARAVRDASTENEVGQQAYLAMMAAQNALWAWAESEVAEEHA